MLKFKSLTPFVVMNTAGMYLAVLEDGTLAKLTWDGGKGFSVVDVPLDDQRVVAKSTLTPPKNVTAG